jgi:hypothetical protein
MVVRWLHSSTRLIAFSFVFTVGLPISQMAATGQDLGLSGSIPVSASPGRRLAADAINIIPASAEYGETFEGPIDLPLTASLNELAWDGPSFPNNSPNYAPASETLLAKTKSVIFRRDIWAMEFGFKPVRMIAVDMTNDNGETQSKLVWYLLYYVRYRGGDLQSTPSKDPFGNEVFAQPSASGSKVSRRFLPGFVLNASALGTRYQSRFIPEAIPLIAEKERVGKPIYDSIAIQKVPVPLSTDKESHDVWGVATWTDIDPRTDFFSVEVRGLTNAQKSEMVNGDIVSQQKTLVLNFSRPGDTINELQDRIRYGVPATADPVQQKAILNKYGLKERLDHYWIYR